MNITASKNTELALYQKKSEIERQNNEYQLLNQELELAISLAASSSEYFQKIFDEAPVGIFLFANDGKITNCNQYFCEITGKKKATILAFKLLDSKFRREINELVCNTFENKYAYFEGKCSSLSDYKNLILKIKTTVVKDSKLKIELGIALVENITQITEFQEKLKIARQQAEESNRLKSAFLANMSHEIRTPLNAVLGFTQILKEKQLDAVKQAKYLNIIHASGTHLLNLINDVLDLSKIEAGQMELDNSTIELNELFEETLNIFQSYKLSQNKEHLEIKISIPKAKIMFYTDRTKLIQILNNLISNAIRFTSTGYVHFGFEISEDRLIVFAEDSGVGIHPEEQELIFERFRQSAYSENKASGGTGLGLALVKAFSDMMQGTINLHSIPGKGSTFMITFPYKGSI